MFPQMSRLLLTCRSSLCASIPGTLSIIAEDIIASFRHGCQGQISAVLLIPSVVVSIIALLISGGQCKAHDGVLPQGHLQRAFAVFRRNRFYVFQEEIAEGDMGLAEPERLQDDVGYLRKRLQQALAQLSDDLRNTYTLFQIGKQSIKQIAAETGASESLVKVRIHRAKQKLQELLADLQEK